MCGTWTFDCLVHDVAFGFFMGMGWVLVSWLAGKVLK